MLHILRNKAGQNTAEYAILIALIVGVAIAMQTYIKRGLQGRVKDAVDKMATDTSTLGTTTQYEPYYLESVFDSTRDAKQTAKELEGGAVSRDITKEEATRKGFQKFLAPSEGK